LIETLLELVGKHVTLLVMENQLQDVQLNFGELKLEKVIPIAGFKNSEKADGK